MKKKYFVTALVCGTILGMASVNRVYLADEPSTTAAYSISRNSTSTNTSSDGLYIPGKDLRLSDTTTPSSGNVIIGVDGTFYQPDVQKVIDKINKIRREAYDEGIVSRYVPIKWAHMLEDVAKTRAVESSFTMNHARLTDKSIWDIGSSSAVSSGAENIAWNWQRDTQSFLQAIDQFYEEKADYIYYQKTGIQKNQIGHYGSLINPNYEYVGMGSFYKGGGYTCVAQRFGASSAGNVLSDASSTTDFGDRVQILEATLASLTQYNIQASDTMVKGTSQVATLNGLLLKNSQVQVLKEVTWTSDDEKVATVDANGKITAKAAGEVTINAKVADQVVKKKITVRAIKNIETVKATTKAGQLPNLPDKVKVTWTDDTQTTEPVKWNKVLDGEVKTNSEKTLEVDGTIMNGSQKVQAAVKVLAVDRVVLANTTTYVKQAPTLPDTVDVIWSDKSTTKEKVNWNAVEPSDYNLKNHSFTVEGTLVDIYSNQKAKVLVNVIEQVEVMYRLYNPNSGEHFYTKAVGERNYLSSIGWKYENIGWKAPASGTAVYRLYNPNASDHHYTTNKAENDRLVKLGWKAEGISWYSGGSKPVYRLYNPNAKGAGAHHYTLSKAESNHLVSLGWKYEGIGWYAVE